MNPTTRTRKIPDEFKNNGSQASILPPTEPPLVERTATAALLENLRRDSEVTAGAPIEMTRKTPTVLVE